MGAVPGSYKPYPLDPGPAIQTGRRNPLAYRPGIGGVDVKVRNNTHKISIKNMCPEGQVNKAAAIVVIFIKPV
jgi:hypothetical protein